MASPLGQKLDNGSSSEAIEQFDKPNVGRSSFDLSRVHTTTVDMGSINVMDWLKVVVGDTAELSAGIFIDNTNPLVKPLMSRVRAYVHCFYGRSADQWKGYQNFQTRGRSGTLNSTLPCLETGSNSSAIHYATAYTDPDTIHFDTPMSLPCQFGIPFNRYYKNPSGIDSVAYPFDFGSFGSIPNFWKRAPYGSSEADNYIASASPSPDDYKYDSGVHSIVYQKINALPFVLYQRIYRDYFCNKNLSQNNKHWFPDNEDDWILPYLIASPVKDIEYTNGNVAYNPVPRNLTSSAETALSRNDHVILAALRYRQYRGDYFTEALPWQYRGDEPLIGSSTQRVVAVSPTTTRTLLGVAGSTTGSNTDVNLSVNPSSAAGVSMFFSVDTSFSANNIRELFTLATLRERMAKTNGDYNQLMTAQFGKNPHLPDRTPTYIGGFYVDLNPSQIESSVATSSEPLGSTAGRLSAVTQQRIGRFDVPDNGYILTLLSIVPDVVYSSQGMARDIVGGVTSADEYQPIFNNLGPQYITESELVVKDAVSFVSLFGWIDRFMHMKTRQNYVSGLLAIPPDIDNFYASRLMIRRFDVNSIPTLSNEFVTCCPATYDQNIFSVPTEPAFVVQFASKVNLIRPMPFRQKPATLNGYAM